MLRQLLVQRIELGAEFFRRCARPLIGKTFLAARSQNSIWICLSRSMAPCTVPEPLAA
jgi:hypothetical protein